MRFLSLFMVISLLFMLLCGCSDTPNMTELLAYESEERTFVLKIQDGKEHSLTLETGAEKATFSFLDESLSGIHVDFNGENAVTLRYDDYTIPLPSSALLKAVKWKAFFELSEKNHLWKIAKENLGGTEVFVCRTEELTLYIDAATRLPLKMTQKDIVIDILECRS